MNRNNSIDIITIDDDCDLESEDDIEILEEIFADNCHKKIGLDIKPLINGNHEVKHMNDKDVNGFEAEVSDSDDEIEEISSEEMIDNNEIMKDDNKVMKDNNEVLKDINEVMIDINNEVIKDSNEEIKHNNETKVKTNEKVNDNNEKTKVIDNEVIKDIVENDCSPKGLIMGSNGSEKSQHFHKCPKRVILTKIDSIPSTSLSRVSEPQDVNSVANDLNQSNGVSANKIRKVEESKPDLKNPDQNYQNYLKAFQERMAIVKDEEIKAQTDGLITKLNEVVFELKIKNKFYKQQQFSKLMIYTARDITNETIDHRVILHHNDMLIELNRMIKPPTKTRPNLSTDVKKRRLEALNTKIKKIQKLIFNAENQVLDYDQLNDVSSFTQLPRLQKLQTKLWRQREELLNRSTITGRTMFKKFTYSGTDYPEINKCAEDLFNGYLKKLMDYNKKGYKDECFNFLDLLNAVKKVINDKQIVVKEFVDELAKKIYKELIDEKKRRRVQDSEETFESLEILDDLKPETMAEDSPALDIKISENKTICERKMVAVVNSYADKEREKYGPEVVQNSVNEWDQNLVDNEDFESIDRTEAELENADEEESDEDSDDNEVHEVIDIDNIIEDNSLRDVTNGEQN